jgi:hypothetical protein
MAATELRVDVWELRCRFNRSGYWQAALNGQLNKRLDRRNFSRNGPPNTFQEQWYIIDPTTGDELARLSLFVHPDGSAATAPDPKHLVVADIDYHLIPGEPIKKDPALRWDHGTWQRRLYVWWRKDVKCRFLGR